MFILLAAALIAATPDSLAGQLESAHPGDTIKLAPGDYGSPEIKQQSWSPAITLDASDAHFTGLRLDGVEGLHVTGGSFIMPNPEKPHTPVVLVTNARDVTFSGSKFGGPGALGIGLTFRKAHDVALDNGQFTGLHRGMVLDEVVGGRIANSSFASLRTDGIDIAASQQVLVDRISCKDFSPEPVDHPDCVQLWSVAGKPPTADITIRNSTAVGTMQGFSGFNHVRNGIDDGGFDRITITDNIVRGTYPHGVALYSARNSRITGNHVSSLPGSRYKVSVNIKYSTDTVVEGNRMDAPKP